MAETVAPERALLVVDRLSKHYGGLAAVRDLSVALQEGEVLGIAGPNGAGKTTLFDTISGYARATAGSILLAGQRIEHLPAHAITHLGVARTFQIPSVFESQTVFANILVASYFGAVNRFVPGLRFDRASIKRAEEAVRLVGLEDKAYALAAPLSLFDKKRIMVACAIATEPRVLLLDELAGGLNPRETDAIFDLVRTLRRERGISVIVIEHVMRALMAISDRVMVMHHGAKLFEGTPDEVLSNDDVIRVYLGSRMTRDAHSGDGAESSANEKERALHVEADEDFGDARLR